ncbi:MAG: hypothetical protein Q7T26_03035 [Dehalococcoidia bacterium]|nr:hypothetical protein [Dehalococcoidia bacterium]
MKAEYVLNTSGGVGGRAALLRVRPDILVKGLIALLAVAYLGLAVGAAVQTRAAEKARKDVSILRDTVAQTSVDVPAVEARLRTAEERRAASTRLVPPRLLASQVVVLVMAEARTAGVDVRDLKANTPEQEKVGDRVYEAHRYSLTAQGDREQVMEFLRRLDAAAMDTLILRSTTITQSKDFFSLGLAFTVYAQPGAAEIAGHDSAPPTPLPQAVLRERARLQATVKQYWDQGGWDLVIGVLNELRNPNVPSESLDAMLYQAYVAHGRDLAGAGKVDMAIAEFRAALALRPGGPEARDGLRRAQEAPGGR